MSDHLAALRGKVVNLSEPRSGTYALAVDVLRFAGLNHARGDFPGDYVATTLSYNQLREVRDRRELPDAVFTVSLLPASVARHLVTKQRFRLVPLPFAPAYSIEEEANVDVSAVSPRAGQDVVRACVYDAVIPAFTYGVDPPVPPEPVHTLGTRLLLVARKDLNPEAVERVLDTVFTSRFAQVAHPPLDPKLLELPLEWPLHEGTVAYLGRNKPIIAEQAIDLLEKEVSIAGGVLGGIFFLWQWLRHRHRRRRDLGFEHYLLRVLAVERQAQELESSAVIDLGTLLRLQQDLTQLKCEALEKFAEGELGGAELMSGFLAQVSDVRSDLTRMILHVRNNLEEEAVTQGRSALSLWHEALANPGQPADADTSPTPGS